MKSVLGRRRGAGKVDGLVAANQLEVDQYAKVDDGHDRRDPRPWPKVPIRLGLAVFSGNETKECYVRGEANKPEGVN